MQIHQGTRINIVNRDEFVFFRLEINIPNRGDEFTFKRETSQKK